MRPWEKYQAPAESSSLTEGPWSKYAAPAPIAEKPAEQVSKSSALEENLLRPIARTARSGLAGIASIADPINMALGQQPVSESVKSLFDKATGGFAKPRNKTEQMVDTTGELFIGGGIIGKAAQAVSKVTTGLTSKIADTLKVTTPQEFGGLAGGSVGVPVAQEGGQKALDLINVSPDSKLRTASDLLLGFGGGIAGGVAGAKATRIPAAVKNYTTMKDLPKSAKVVAADLERQGMTPQEALQALSGDAGMGLSPIDVNTAQISNLKDLGQIAGSRKVLENAFDDREKSIIKAQNNILNGITADDTALVNLSKEYNNRLLKKRSETARPLWKEGLSQGTKIPLDTPLGRIDAKDAAQLEINSGDLTLERLLQSPVIRKAINAARNKSLKYSNSPAEEIYGNIYQKTKPVYETKNVAQDIITEPKVSRDFAPLPEFAKPVTREIKLGAAANEQGKEYITKTKLKTPSQYIVPDNDVRVLNAVDSILYDQIGKVGVTGYTKEQTALKLARNSIKNLVENANPILKDASAMWSRDTQEILLNDETTIGVIARLAADKYDEAADKLSRLSPAEISAAKIKLMSIDANKYNQAIKAFIDKKIDSLKGNQELTKFFGSELEKKKMRAMFPNGQAFQGFEKAINYIEKTKPAQDALRTALRKEIEAAPLTESISEGRSAREAITQLPARTVRKGKELTGLSEPQIKKEIDKKEAEILARYALTDEGQLLFQELSRLTKKPEIDNTMLKIRAGILTTLGTKEPNQEQQ